MRVVPRLTRAALLAAALVVTPVAAYAGSLDSDADGNNELLVSSPGGSTDGFFISEPASGDSLVYPRFSTPVDDQVPIRAGGAGVACDIDGDLFDDAVYGDIAMADLSEAGDFAAGGVIVSFGSEFFVSGGTYVTQNDSGVPGISEEQDFMGLSVACGDTSGDGFDDVLVGIPGEDVGSLGDAGAAVYIPGSSTGLDLAGSQLITQDTAGISGTAEAGDDFARAVHIGDVTGDGLGDLIIGAPGENSDAGIVHSIPGAAAGFTATGSTTISSASLATDAKRLGEALAVGRFNTGTVGDLAIYSAGPTGAGRIYVANGSATNVSATGAKLVNQSTTGVPGTSEAGDRWGQALSAGQVTSDVYDDLLVGAPGEDVGSATNAGSLTLVKGSSGGLTGAGAQTFSQDTAGVGGTAESGDALGSSVLAIDLSGDGRDEAHAGAPTEAIGTVKAGIVMSFPATGTGLTATGSATLTADSMGGDNTELADFGRALIG